MQRHGAGGGAFAVEAGALGLAAGGGKPLPDAVRGKMEAALGADFSAVRVHVGPQAERIGAIAFTVGSDIYFAPGRYQPDSAHGQQLLGHELAHVVQQRAGRVKNPLGSGLAVVQDHILEAEADRLGRQAAAHRIAAQPKMPSGAAQLSQPVRISPPVSAGPGSYRLTAGAGGRLVGSVTVHARDKGAVEVTDLNVSEAQRGQGIGRMLVASAARTGQQFGRSMVTLAAQDKGSGHLTQWYKEMGFTQTGANQHGYPRLEAPINRLVRASAQRKPFPRSSSTLQAMDLLPADFFDEDAEAVALGVKRPTTPPKTTKPTEPPKTFTKKDPRKVLKGLATPKVSKCPDIKAESKIVEELDKLIDNKEDKRIPRTKLGVPKIMCLGGIEMPKNLMLTEDKLIKSAKLIRLTQFSPDDNVADSYDAISDNTNLQYLIKRYIIKTLSVTNQIKYLNRSGLTDSDEWKILVEIHYYYDRDKFTSFFHKDTLGQTLFVNLNYVTDAEISGPEYILKPPLVAEHEKLLRHSLPPVFRQHLADVRESLNEPTKIEATTIPAHGVVSFVDELIHHMTPSDYHRTVTGNDLLTFLSKEDPSGFKIYDAISLVPQHAWWKTTVGQKWAKWFAMTREIGTSYNRKELSESGLSDAQVNKLIGEHSAEKGFRNVSIPNPGGKSIVEPIPALTRTTSERLLRGEKLPEKVKGRRCFFRTWVRAVPSDAIL